MPLKTVTTDDIARFLSPGILVTVDQTCRSKLAYFTSHSEIFLFLRIIKLCHWNITRLTSESVPVLRAKTLKLTSYETAGIDNPACWYQGTVAF
jgi:hypothetical protein